MMRVGDLKIETIKPRPQGGQHVYPVVLPVRVTHIPTGISAQVGSEMSQFKNKKLAMEMVEWGLENYDRQID